MGAEEALVKSLSGFEFKTNPYLTILRSEFKEVLNFILSLLVVIATWWIFFNWSPDWMIPGHDSTRMVLPYLKNLAQAGTDWQSSLYRLEWMGGTKLIQMAGNPWYVSVAIRLGIPFQMIPNLEVFGIQAAYAYLGIRSITALVSYWNETQFEVSMAVRVCLTWLLAFAPILAWRLCYGHSQLLLASLVLITFLAGLLDGLAGQRKAFPILLSVLISHAVFQTAMQQPVIYGAVFGSPILFGILVMAGSGRQSGCRKKQLLILGQAILPVALGLLLSIDSFYLLLIQAKSGDSARSLGGNSIVYSYLRGHIRDWTASLTWALKPLTHRPQSMSHEVNYPLGPLFLFFLFFYPWKRFWQGGVGILFSILLVIGFSNGFEPVSHFLLKIVPPLNSFRVPTRGALTFGLVIPIVGLASLLYRFSPNSKRRSGRLVVLVSLLGLSLGSILSFQDRALPFHPWKRTEEELLSLRKRILEKAPDLISPLVRAHLAGNPGLKSGVQEGRVGALNPAPLSGGVPPLPKGRGLPRLDEMKGSLFGANAAEMLGFSSADGYFPPLIRYLQLAQAIRKLPYDSSVNFIDVEHSPELYRIFQALYNIRYEVRRGNERGGILVKSLPGAIGPAWIPEKLSSVRSFNELAEQLVGSDSDLNLTSSKLKKTGWIIQSDPVIQSLESSLRNFTPSESCRSIEIQRLDSSHFGQRIDLTFSSRSSEKSAGETCPLVLSMNFSQDFIAYAELSGGMSHGASNGLSNESSHSLRGGSFGRALSSSMMALPVFPIYGSLTGVLIPASASRLMVEMKVEAPFWTDVAKGSGFLLCILVFGWILWKFKNEDIDLLQNIRNKGSMQIKSGKSKGVGTIGVVFLFCLSFSQSFLTQGWAGVDSALSGTITDPQGVALSGIQVQLLNPRNEVIQENISSETGSYQFYPIQFGKYSLEATGVGFESFHGEVQISSGENATFDFQMSPLKTGLGSSAGGEMVMEVKAKKRLIQASSSVSSTEMGQAEISNLPRGGETSLPRLLTSTVPGAVGGAFGQVFFRGNHASIQYQIDGVQLPDSVSNTFGESFSPRNIDRMEVITGGIPAEYGQRLAAVVNIVTKSGPETPEGDIQLNYGTYNTFSPRLLYGGSNSSGNLRYYLSANFNRTDRGLDTPNPVSTAPSDQTQGGAESVHNTSIGNSEFARVDWLADNENRFSLVFFRGQTDRQIPNYPSSFLSSDPYFSSGYTDVFGNEGDHGAPTYKYVPPETEDRQSEMNLYGQVVWKRTFSENSFFQLAPYYKHSSILVTPDPIHDLAANTLISGSEVVSFGQDRRVNNLGIKGDSSYRPNQRHLIKTGFQLQASREDGSISIQKNLTDPVFTDQIATNGYFESVYIQDDWTLLPSLVLNAGLRFDATQLYFSDLTPMDSMLQPRIGLNYMLTDVTKLHLFYGKLFQPAGLENLRRTFEVFGEHPHPEPYDIKAEKDDYYEAGVTQQLFGNQVARAVVFYKDGVNILDDAQLLRTSIAQPFNFAVGYSYGAELSLKGEIGRNWSEYVNYSYLIAKGKGISGGAWASDHGSDDWQVMDHAQTHTLNAGLTYTRGPFWWSTQGLYGSGLRTGPNNSIDLPSHLTFDTTLGYTFMGRSWYSNFKLSGDILNVFDNRYPITIANAFNNSHYAAGRQFVIRLTKTL